MKNMKLMEIDTTPIQKAIAAVLKAFKDTDTMSEIAPEAMGVCVQRVLENIREWDNNQSCGRGQDYCHTVQGEGADFFLAKDPGMDKGLAAQAGSIMAATAQAILRVSSWGNADYYAAKLVGQKLERWYDFGENQERLYTEDAALYAAVNPYAERAYRAILHHPRMKAGIDAFLGGSDRLPDDALERIEAVTQARRDDLEQRYADEQEAARVMAEDEWTRHGTLVLPLENSFEDKVAKFAESAIARNDLGDMRACEVFVDAYNRWEFSQRLNEVHKRVHDAIAACESRRTVNIREANVGQFINENYGEAREYGK